MFRIDMSVPCFAPTFLFSSYIMAQIHEEGNISGRSFRRSPLRREIAHDLLNLLKYHLFKKNTEILTVKGIMTEIIVDYNGNKLILCEKMPQFK